MVNQIIITGRLTKDPVSSMSGKDHKTLKVAFSMAYNRRYRNRTKDKPEVQTTFVRVWCWGTLARNVIKYLHKARFILVRGRLDQRRYRDKHDGQLHIFNYIEAESINWDFPEDPEKMEKYRKTDLAQLRAEIRRLKADTTIELNPDSPDVEEKPTVSTPKQGDTFYVDSGPISLIDTYLDDDPDPMDKDPF